MDKRQLSETDIRTKFITPAILGKKLGVLPAKWGGGMLAWLPSQTACSIAKSNVLRGSAPS